MFGLNSLILFGCITLICIPFIHSITLDGSCESDADCGGTGAVCRSKKCQCDTPFYTPCERNNCNVQEKIVYEGKACRVNGNCMENAFCNGTQHLCRCQPKYIAMNGLCYKNLNVHCMASSECWSNECRGNTCQCPWGSIPREDNRRCRVKFAAIHPNWNSANNTGDFCFGNDQQHNCLVRSAVCQGDSQHVEKFCQCPVAHTADYDKQECRPIDYDELSPSIKPLPAKPCGKCRDENAICADVVNQTTCWCRAGFNNSGNQCVKSGKVLIFPNQKDSTLRDYTSQCSASKNYGLCSCSPGQFFDDRNRSCQSIVPQWVNNEFEYGVCTRINSNGRPLEEHDLCPQPLHCQPRRDKYICSCGLQRYLNDNRTACHYYLEKPLIDPKENDCPANSILIENVCRCNPPNIFKQSKDQKYCELILNGTSDLKEGSSCGVANATGDSLCEKFYGGNARFCRQGVCHCQQSLSYVENNRCITLIGEKVADHGYCPVNAKISEGICECQVGYRVENKQNRTCVRKVNGLNEIMTSLIDGDCEVLFPEQPIQLINHSCQCTDEAFSNGSMCIPYLDKPLSSDKTMICPAFAKWNSNQCQCLKGYKNVDNETCNRWAEKVYPYNFTAGVNTTGIEDKDCKALFGSAAEKVNWADFCSCRLENISYFNADKCYFLVNTIVGQIDSEWSCPLNSTKNGTHCDCVPGYQPKSDNQGCEIKLIAKSKLQAVDVHTYGVACNPKLTNGDCQVFFGEAAICRNDSCYCDRKRSYVHNNRCVLFSDVMFPGAHQLHLYTCQSIEDCGSDAEKKNIDCQLIDENYRVCQCRQGYFFNPIDNTCVPSQCYPSCSSNKICQNFQCICPVGFYEDSSKQCVKFIENLKLHDGCNASYWSGSTEGDLECSYQCERVRCSLGYEDDGSKCVKKTFDSPCFNGGDFCSMLDRNSICDHEEKRCVCGMDSYLSSIPGICIRAVGSSCVQSDECGELGECSNKICVCKSNHKIIDSYDHFGRKIQTCMINGIDQMRFDFILLLFVVIVRLVFA